MGNKELEDAYYVSELIKCILIQRNLYLKVFNKDPILSIYMGTDDYMKFKSSPEVRKYIDIRKDYDTFHGCKFYHVSTKDHGVKIFAEDE